MNICPDTLNMACVLLTSYPPPKKENYSYAYVFKTLYLSRDFEFHFRRLYKECCLKACMLKVQKYSNYHVHITIIPLPVTWPRQYLKVTVTVIIGY